MSDFYVEIFNCSHHIPWSQHICKVVETVHALKMIDYCEISSFKLMK